MKTTILAIGGLVAAGGGALLAGRLTGSRWTCRVGVAHFFPVPSRRKERENLTHDRSRTSRTAAHGVSMGAGQDTSG